MVFGKSITFDENGLSDAAHAAAHDPAFHSAENEFLDRLRSGESEAFDILVRRYSADIYALLFRITQNGDEAGDLVQETFLRAFKAIRRFRGDSELKTWLFPDRDKRIAQPPSLVETAFSRKNGLARRTERRHRPEFA
jgi:hypothetical protein